MPDNFYIQFVNYTEKQRVFDFVEGEWIATPAADGRASIVVQPTGDVVFMIGDTEVAWCEAIGRMSALGFAQVLQTEDYPRLEVIREGDGLPSVIASMSANGVYARNFFEGAPGTPYDSSIPYDSEQSFDGISTARGADVIPDDGFGGIAFGAYGIQAASYRQLAA